MKIIRERDGIKQQGGLWIFVFMLKEGFFEFADADSNITELLENFINVLFSVCHNFNGGYHEFFCLIYIGFKHFKDFLFLSQRDVEFKMSIKL